MILLMDSDQVGVCPVIGKQKAENKNNTKTTKQNFEKVNVSVMMKCFGYWLSHKIIIFFLFYSETMQI